MRIIVIQLFTDNIKELGQYSSNKMKNYCEKYNYDYKCFANSLDETRHPAWSKIKAILTFLENKDYDWIWFIDIDAFVINDSYKLEEIIETYARNDKDIIFTDQKYRRNINSGSMLVKNTEFSKQLFLEVYDNILESYRWKCCWEQDSINRLIFGSTNVTTNPIINEKYKEKIVVVKNNVFNSVFNPANTCDHLRTYNSGDFVIHFAGPISFDQIKIKLKEIGKL